MKKEGPEAASGEPAISNRWWVDQGGTEKAKVKRPAGPAGSRFFRAAEGFEQERARTRLTDNNMKVLREADPAEGSWAYVRLGDAAFPERELEQIKRLIALPPYARGVIVDCGRSLRALVTATPPGERLLELSLGDAPSFDCWVRDEWVREALFEDGNKAIKAFKRFIREYLSPEEIARAESVAARA